MAFYLQSMRAGERAKGRQHSEVVVEEKRLHFDAPAALASKGSARVQVAAQQEAFGMVLLDVVQVEGYV